MINIGSRCLIDEFSKFKNFERKIKQSFMKYAHFQNIRVPEDNGKLNTDES